jgi:hypothetical protein
VTLPTLRSRSVFLDVASASLLALGAAGVSFLPTAARVAVAIAFFLGIGRLSLRLARFLLPGEDRATALTATLVLLVACWTLAATALGHFGVLTPRTIFLTVALALLASAARGTRAPAPPERVARPGDPTERAAVLAALAFFGISTALVIFSERNAPPGAQGYDDTSYHLSAVATWHEWHDLRSLKFPIGDGSTTFYPIVGELFSLLLLVPLGGIDFLARWSEVPFALASLAALTSLARLLSLRAGAAGVAILLYAATPRVFPSGMLGAGNDHAMGFFVLASACGALLLRRGPNPRRATFLGAALGLLIGTKYTGVMFLPPLLLLAAAGAASGLLGTPARDRRPALRSAGLGCLAGAVAMLGVGGYTYLRNAVGTGNPLFPVTLGIGGHRLLQGWSGDTLTGLAVRGRSELQPLRFLWDRADLLGPLFRWILLPAAVLAPLLAFASWLASRVRRSRAGQGQGAEAGEIVLLTLPAVLYLTFVRLMVDHRDIRYVYGGLALAGIAVAWLLERLPRQAARWGRLAVILLVLATLVASQHAKGGTDRVLAVGAMTAAIVVADVLFRNASLRWPRVGLTLGNAAVAAALVALASAGASRLLETYLARKLDTNPAASFLDREAPPGTTIAFCGGNQPYPFFGRRLQNRLLYVPTYAGPPTRGGLTPPLGASFFTWRGPLEFPRHLAVHDEWRENLRRLEVGFVVVARTGEELPERDWIAIEPEAFTRVYADSRTEVFAVHEVPPRRDYLRVDTGRPESDYFFQGDWRREKRGGEVRALLLVPPGGADVMIPPLDAPATSVGLEGDGPEGPLPALRLSLNGAPAEGAAVDRHRVRFRVGGSAWRAGRNRLSIAPAAPDKSGEIRIAALELTLDETRPMARRGSGDLPGNLDAPAEGSPIRGGVLAAAGWCRERGGGRIDPVRFTLDGRDATPLRSTRPDRPDVVAVLPYVVEPKETGFSVELDVSALSAGDHNLVVELETPDGRRRTFPPRRFRLVR